MRLNVGGRRGLRWLNLPAVAGAALLSKLDGAPDIYSEDIGPSCLFPVDGRNGLWNKTAGCPWKEVLVAPWVAAVSGGGSCRMEAMSTRSSGHGMP